MYWPLTPGFGQRKAPHFASTSLGVPNDILTTYRPALLAEESVWMPLPVHSELLVTKIDTNYVAADCQFHLLTRMLSIEALYASKLPHSNFQLHVAKPSGRSSS